MNCDLQTCLHVLESGSINEDSFREVLNLFHGFSSHTELVDSNRVDTATVFCRILSACQNLYEIDTWEKLPKDAAEQLIQSFNNIERLYHDTSKDERKGTYIRTIWFLSELKTKDAEGRTEEIDKRIIGEYAKDLLDVFQDIRFVFDIQWVDKYVTPKYFPQPYIDDNDNFQQSEKRAFTGTRCYGLRCAVLHSGNEDLSRNHMDLDDESGIDPANKVYRIYLFDDPEHEIVYSTGSKTNESVEIDFFLNIHKFCARICEGAKKTIEQFGETDAIEKYSIEVLEYGRPL